MCPLRFLLIFASLIVAAFLAFKSLWVVVHTDAQKQEAGNNGEGAEAEEEEEEEETETHAPPSEFGRGHEAPLRLVGFFLLLPHFF